MKKGISDLSVLKQLNYPLTLLMMQLTFLNNSFDINLNNEK